MKLEDWILKKQVRLADMAQVLGIGRTSLYNFLHKGAPIKLITAYKIILLTEGEVGLEDLVTLDQEEATAEGNTLHIPEKLQQLLDKEKEVLSKATARVSAKTATANTLDAIRQAKARWAQPGE